MNYIERHQELFLSSWLKRLDRKPLIIRGARQVGKSTLVRNFATKSGRQLIEVNFEEYQTSLRKVFETGTFEEVLNALIRVVGVDFRIDSSSYLLFMDEIQTIPAALKMLRYFYEKLGQLPVIAAGSILEFTLNDDRYSMPVGRVEYLYIPPLSFKEFLCAKQRQDLIETINKVTLKTNSIPSIQQHTELLGILREFFLVGGMPEAVTIYSQGKYSDCRRIQSSILSAYRDDLQKYPATNHIRSIVREAFDRSAALIKLKVKYKDWAPENTSRDVKKALQLLLDAGLFTEVLHSEGNGIPLASEMDVNVRKFFGLDIGLLCAALGLDNQDIPDITNTSFINGGALAEQFVAQELSATESNFGSKQKIFYWLREGRSNNAEVDFLSSLGTNIFAIEVKSGSTGTMKSLFEFLKAKNSKFAVRLDVNLPSLQKISLNNTETILLSLPIYMTSEIKRILRENIKPESF